MNSLILHTGKVLFPMPISETKQLLTEVRMQVDRLEELRYDWQEATTDELKNWLRNHDLSVSISGQVKKFHGIYQAFAADYQRFHALLQQP